MIEIHYYDLPGNTSSQSTFHCTPNCEENSLFDLGCFQGLIFQHNSLNCGTVVGTNSSTSSKANDFIEYVIGRFLRLGGRFSFGGAEISMHK